MMHVSSRLVCAVFCITKNKSNMLEKGLTHTSRIIVGTCDTAIAFGSGDMPVLATPRMVALLENAAMMAVTHVLPAGSTTVGGHIDVSHIKPSAVGTIVNGTATLDKIDGRKLYFTVRAVDKDGTVVGEGTHLRFIVDREKFMDRLPER